MKLSNLIIISIASICLSVSTNTFAYDECGGYSGGQDNTGSEEEYTHQFSPAPQQVSPWPRHWRGYNMSYQKLCDKKCDNAKHYNVCFRACLKHYRYQPTEF